MPGRRTRTRSLPRSPFRAFTWLAVVGLLVSLLVVPGVADAASPSTTIDRPTEGQVTGGDLVLTGSATADSGVDHVELTLRNLDTGRYWNGSSWQTGWIRYPVPVDGAPTSATWSASVPAGALTQGSYSARAWTRAANGDGDPLGNAQVAFTWTDRPPPVEDLTVLATTEDSVTVGWSNPTDGRRVSFDLFVDDTWVTYRPDPSTTAHTFTGLDPSTTYLLGVTAKGGDGFTYSNQSYSSRIGVTATTADPPSSPPGTTLTTPADGSTIDGSLILSGRATATSGVDHVELVLRNVDTGRYWNGSSWQDAWIRYSVAVPGSPTETTWTETVSTLDLTQGSYYARAWTRAVDGAGDPVGETRSTFAWNDRLRPAADLRVTATTDTTATVAWTNTDDDDRRVSFDFFVDDVWVGYVTNPSATSYTFTGLDPDTTHKLGVTAVGDRNLTYTNQWYSPRANVGATTGAGDPDPGGETVVFRDDFDTFDDSVWTPEHTTYGDGNNELQCYRPSNVSVANGKLVLRGVKETYTCPSNGSTRQYTSGMIRSRGVTFSPGQAIEFRVKLTPADPDNQRGLWPAVWASGWGGGGWPTGGEMDWLEVMTANDPTRSVYTIHFENTEGRRDKRGREVFGAENFSARWHTVRFEYGVGGVLTWFLDGAQVHQVTSAPTIQGWPTPFDQAVTEIKINLALGGNPGPLQDSALGQSGATFEVDYIQISDMN